MRGFHELDGFTAGKATGFTGEISGSDDDDFIGVLGSHDAEHFANDGRTHGIDLPLLALNECGVAVPAENEINAAVGTSAQGKVHGVSLAAIGLGDQELEVFPSDVAEGFETGLVIEKMATAQTEPKGDGSEQEEQEQNDGSDADEGADEHLTSFVITGPDRKPPAQADEHQHAKHGAHPPRSFDEQFAPRFIATRHAARKAEREAE